MKVEDRRWKTRKVWLSDIEYGQAFEIEDKGDVYIKCNPLHKIGGCEYYGTKVRNGEVYGFVNTGVYKLDAKVVVE